MSLSVLLEKPFRTTNRLHPHERISFREILQRSVNLTIRWRLKRRSSDSSRLLELQPTVCLRSPANERQLNRSNRSNGPFQTESLKTYAHGPYWSDGIGLHRGCSSNLNGSIRPSSFTFHVSSAGTLAKSLSIDRADPGSGHTVRQTVRREDHHKIL